MSGRSIFECHKTKLENCMGRLVRPGLEYGKWAFWCSDVALNGSPSQSGWYPTDCGCTNRDRRAAAKMKKR